MVRLVGAICQGCGFEEIEPAFAKVRDTRWLCFKCSAPVSIATEPYIPEERDEPDADIEPIGATQ